MTRRRLVTVGAVAAFVLVVASVAVVASRDDGDGGAKALPKLRFNGSAETGSTSAAAPGDRALLAPAGRVTYEVRGNLPALGGTAPAYSATPDAAKERVDKLAAALGVPAERVTVDSQQKPQAGKDPTLVVVQGSWSLVSIPPDCTVSSDGVTTCTATAVAAPAGSAAGSSGSSGSGSGTTVANDCPMPPCPAGAACAQVCPEPDRPSATVVPPAPPAPPQRPADLPSKDEAERIGRSVLEKAGYDLSGADVRVDDQFTTWSVSVSPRVDGLATTGLDSMVMIGAKGAVVGGYGSLVKLTKVGDYPLAGSAKGLERLRSGLYAGPVPMMGAGAAASDAKQPIAPDQTVPEQKVVITGVHVALARSFVQGDRVTLAPVYVFEVEGGGNLLPVPAVIDSLLDTTTPSTVPPPDQGKTEPAPAPAPVPAPATTAP